jgi:alpha-mannosidase
MEQGERTFKLWLNGGNAEDRLSKIDIESQIKNEGLMILCSYPSGSGKKVLPSVKLSNNLLRLSALKLAENNNNLIIRLFNPTKGIQDTEIKFPSVEISHNTKLGINEIKSFKIDLDTRLIEEVDLMERVL